MIAEEGIYDEPDLMIWRVWLLWDETVACSVRTVEKWVLGQLTLAVLIFPARTARTSARDQLTPVVLIFHARRVAQTSARDQLTLGALVSTVEQGCTDRQHREEEFGLLSLDPQVGDPGATAHPVAVLKEARASIDPVVLRIQHVQEIRLRCVSCLPALHLPEET